MKTYNVIYVKRIFKEIQADNRNDAAYQAALNMPENCIISNIEEKKELKQRQENVSDLFHEIGEMFNPNKK